MSPKFEHWADAYQRIQLSRAKGWRKPEGAIVVSRPSRWGNPFVVGDEATINVAREMASVKMTPALAVACYADIMKTRLTIDPTDMPEDAAWVQSWHDGLKQLRGHDLACWCPLDQPCHADVLLELANPR